MGKSFTFMSLTCENVLYLFDTKLETSNSFFNSPHDYAHSCAKYCYTSSDHIPHGSWQQVAKEYACDYFGSLAFYLVNHTEHIPQVAHEWPYKESSDRIEFFSKLIWKKGETKTTYYSKEENKKSTSSSKQYDKRWEAVPEWADGSVLAIYRLMEKSYYSFIERFLLVQQIRDFLMNHGKSIYFDWETILCIKYELVTSQSIEAIQRIVVAYRQMENAKASISCLENNWLRNKAMLSDGQIEERKKWIA